MNLKPWNTDLKMLRENIFKEDKLEENLELCLHLHAMVHLSEMSDVNEITFEDELWDGLNENVFRTATNEKGRTIAYGLWHSARIEDITMNMLVNGDPQVFSSSWQQRIGSSITDTGNALSAEEIFTWSKNIDMQELKNYRMAVGRKTREIIGKLTTTDMKRKMEKGRLQQILKEHAVLNVEGASWLIDFWGKKNVSGILFMPVTRHHVVHINESLSAKKKGLKK